MIKLFIGAIAAAVAMFLTGFLFFATPLQFLATGPSIPTAQQAAIQSVLAANLPSTGTYAVPQPTDAEATVMYGKGPIATIHYNAKGYSAEDPTAIFTGFIHEVIVCLLLAGALSTLDRRIPDFGSRARIVVLFSIAATGLITLGEPIWYHHDWPNFIYGFVANTAMLIVAGLVIARWFLPKAAEMTTPVAVPSPVFEKPQEPTGG